MLRIDVNTSNKYVDIWLAHGEALPEFQEIQKCFSDFDIVIWRSGHGDLATLTADLLRSNK